MLDCPLPPFRTLENVRFRPMRTLDRGSMFCPGCGAERDNLKDEIAALQVKLPRQHNHEIGHAVHRLHSPRYVSRFRPVRIATCRHRPAPTGKRLCL